MMKNIFIIVTSLILFIGCIKESIRIETKKNVINDGETYTAKIYAPIYDSTIFPRYFIIQNNIDTHRLITDNNKGCGIFRAVGYKDGQTKYVGFAEYINKEGEYEKKEFAI